MIGVVVIAHAPLAGALVACAEHVYGRPPAACRVIDVLAESEPDVHRRQAERAIAAVDDGDGVLVLVDLFGATPGNVAQALVDAGHVEVIAGVNLPMLLRVLCYRDSCALDALPEKAVSGGLAGILKIASLAPQDQQRQRSFNPCSESDDGDPRLTDQQ